MNTTAVTNFAERVQDGRARILRELRKVIVGQDEVVDQVLMALFTGGHCLITGVPGLAKTLLIKTVAEILDLSFKRIQFTPDLMPSDITGTEILEEQHGTRSLRFVHGPIFAQILLADEINRTPPKTQAALLEAMQEYHVTAAGRTYQLERPFFVLATQNPIEHEGTYPLPEAQLDRFMFNIVMTYLPEDDEVRVVTDTTGTEQPADLARAGRRRHPRVSAGRAAGDRQRRDRALRRAPGGRVAARTAWRTGSRQQVCEVGSRPARVAGDDSRLEGARADERPPPRRRERRPGAGRTDPAPPHRHELLRRVRNTSPLTPPPPPSRKRGGPSQKGVKYGPLSRPSELRFLDPAVLARLGTLELKARTVVEGFLSGLHRSPFKGFSVEFAEYRQYVPGDDLSTLDWKVYARTDRHYVKKFEEETNLECHLLLDVSASMGYGSRGAQSNVARPLNDLAEAMLKRSLVVLISDLLDDPVPVVQGLKRLRFRGTDVLVFHVLDPDELTFPFRGSSRFRDLENGEQITAEPSAVRAHYLRELAALTSTYERELRGVGIDYVQIDTSKPLDFALVPYLAARGRRG